MARHEPGTIHPLMAPLLTMPNSRFASRVVILVRERPTCAGEHRRDIAQT
jgi:hypothetical protein